MTVLKECILFLSLILFVCLICFLFTDDIVLSLYYLLLLLRGGWPQENGH